MHKQAKLIKTPAAPTSTITREEAERLVGEITAFTLRVQDLTTKHDEEKAALRESYEAQTKPFNDRIAEITPQVRDWALAHPEEFGKRKSISMLHGVIGFRTGTPKLKTLAGWTFARVLHTLSGLAWGRSFIRVKEEVDKEGLIAAYATTALGATELASIGCRVDQDETFFVEPAITETEPRQVVAGKEGK